MTWLQALILGLLQGATEFIPVSSSGHLTLVPWLFNWSFDPDLKFAYDVMAHWGTLIAVLAVFWSDLWALVRGWLRTLGLNIGSPGELGEGAPTAKAGPVGVGADTRLYIANVPRLGAQHTQDGGGVHRARAHLHVVGLPDEATLLGPIVM